MKKIITLILAVIMSVSLLAPAALADSGERTLVSSEDWLFVTIDPGHGGNAGGGCRINGRLYSETELVLKIAYYLKDELETYSHVKVNLTRKTNSVSEYRQIEDLQRRLDIAQANHSDLLISLHLNGTNKPNSASGACVLVPNGNYRPELAQQDVALAKCILKHLTGLGLGLYQKDGLLYRNSETRPPECYPNGKIADYYGIIRGGILRNFVSILVEHCFIDNYKEAANHLSSDAQLKELAIADAKGIADYYGLHKKTAEELDANEYCLTDYRTHWARETIDEAVTQGWVKGYPDDTFHPNESVTRGQFLTFAGRMMGIDVEQYGGTSFPDVSETAYYAPYVQWAADSGIVDGYPDGSFGPDKMITREQVAKILVNMLESAGYDTTGEYSLSDFGIKDVGSISDWAADYVAFCYYSGLLKGSDGSFEPKRAVTRAEACTVLSRMQNFIDPMS